MRKIPATVITGFLGAGKTTLVRHLLQSAGGRRYALIVNEFGDLGVDRDILGGCGLEACGGEDGIVELANGCLCCTVADEFLPTMQALIERETPPDHILIETSGLALPKPLIKAFHWPEIRSRVTVDGVVAVVDADAVAAGRFATDPDAVARQQERDPGLDHDNPLEEVFTDQMQAADLVLLNKTDLLDAARMAAVRDAIAPHLRTGVKAVATSHGQVDAEVLLGIDAAAEDDLDTRPSHHDGADGHDHDDFESFAVTLGPVGDPDALEVTVARVVAEHGILRIKGVVHVPGKAMRHVFQGVGVRFSRYYDRPWRRDEERQSRLVVIGEKGMDRGAIVGALGGEEPA